MAGGIGALGTAPRVHLQTPADRTVPGWFSVRRPEDFQAGRKRVLGTAPLSLFNKVLRAVPGWFSARAPEIFMAGGIGALGTAPRVHLQTPADRTVPGWFSVRRPEDFQAGRKRVLGTAPLSLFNKVLRAVPGWFSARAPEAFPVEANAAGCDFDREPTGDVFHAASNGVEGPLGYHLPVMVREVGEWMAAGPGKLIVDGTLGGGGHSAIFLEAGASVLGIDRDPEAIAFSSRRLASHGARFRTRAGNFADFLGDPEVRGEGQADGLLLDLGVSSRQLDEAARGFSFMRQGPLDMRMGPSSPRTAADVVNGWSEGDLVRLFFEFGEEPKARRIAASIAARRAERPFDSTSDLADCIERAVGRSGRTHPATRSFQAIRIAVNDELDSLRRALELAPRMLKPGGRLLIITFHSLEDRMVKRYLQARSVPWLDDPTWPEPRPNPDRAFRLPLRKALAPSADEISRNPRARSAKLRVAERLAQAYEPTPLPST